MNVKKQLIHYFSQRARVGRIVGISKQFQAYGVLRLSICLRSVQTQTNS